MNHLAVVEEGSDREPMGFNCGPSDLGKANWIVQELRSSLTGSMRIFGPEMQSGPNGDDFIVTVRCKPGTLTSVQLLVEMSIAIWRARGQIQ